MKRRAVLLGCSVPFTPLAALWLSGCADEGHWPDGMVPIKWDRDTCARCSMAISDRRFAAEVRGGARRDAFKFDDIGCLATWCSEKLKDHPWLGDAATRAWVSEFGAGGERWLDARAAHYAKGPRSPMGYDWAAHAQPQPGSLAFEAMSRQVVATWPANCLPRSAA